MSDRPRLAGKSVLVLGGADFIGSRLVDRHLASIDLARELIGYEPRTSLSDGLADTVAWYLESMGIADGR